MRHHQPTRDHVERAAEGLSKGELNRCLSRCIAGEILNMPRQMSAQPALEGVHAAA